MGDEQKTPDLTTQAVMDLAKFMKTECLVELQVGNVRIVRSYQEAIYRDQTSKAAEFIANNPAPTDEQLLFNPMHGLKLGDDANV